jgi:hypothetical protein
VAVEEEEVDENEEKKQALCRRVDKAIAAVSVLNDGRGDLSRLLFAHPHHAQRLLDEAIYLGEHQQHPRFHLGRSCQSVSWQGVSFTYDSTNRHFLIAAEILDGGVAVENEPSLLTRFA